MTREIRTAAKRWPKLMGEKPCSCNRCQPARSTLSLGTLYSFAPEQIRISRRARAFALFLGCRQLKTWLLPLPVLT